MDHLRHRSSGGDGDLTAHHFLHAKFIGFYGKQAPAGRTISDNAQCRSQVANNGIAFSLGLACTFQLYLYQRSYTPHLILY